MSQQSQQQQQEVLKAVVQALSQGAKPEELAKALIQKGVPQESAANLVKAGMQYVQSQGSAQQQGSVDYTAGGDQLPSYAAGAAALLANPQVLSAAIGAAPAVMDKLDMKNGGMKEYQQGGHIPMFNALMQNPSEIDTVASIRPDAIKGMMNGSGTGKQSKESITINSPVARTHKLAKFMGGGSMDEYAFGGNRADDRGMDEYGKGYYKDIENQAVAYNDDPNRDYYVKDLEYKNRGFLGRLLHPNNPQKKVKMSFAPKQQGYYTMGYDHLDPYMGQKKKGELSGGSDDGMPSIEDIEAEAAANAAAANTAATRTPQNADGMKYHYTKVTPEGTWTDNQLHNEGDSRPAYMDSYYGDTDASTFTPSSDGVGGAATSAGSSGGSGGGSGGGGGAGGGGSKYGGLKKYQAGVNETVGGAYDWNTPMPQKFTPQSEPEYDFMADVQANNPQAQYAATAVTTDDQMGFDEVSVENPAKKVQIAQETLKPGYMDRITPVSEDGTSIDYTQIDDARTQGDSFAYEGDEPVSNAKINDDDDPVTKQTKMYGASQAPAEAFALMPSNKPGVNLLQGLGLLAAGSIQSVKDIKDAKPGRQAAKDARKQNKAARKASKKASKKEGGFTPHMMYDGKGQPYFAKTVEDHNKYAQLGYVHEDEMKYGGLPKYQGNMGSSTVGGGFSSATMDSSSMTDFDWASAGQGAGGFEASDPTGGYSSGMEGDYGIAYTGGDEDVVDFGMTGENTENMRMDVDNENAADEQLQDEQEKEEEKKKEKAKGKMGQGKMSGSDMLYFGLDKVNTGLEGFKEKRKWRESGRHKALAAGNTMSQAPTTGAAYGHQTTNRTVGSDMFLSEHDYANLGYGYKHGGMTNYRKGDEVYMTQEQMEKFIQMGGVVEIVDESQFTRR